MRIFYVTTEYIDNETLEVFHGGLANYLNNITSILSKKGHDINVIVCSNVNKIISYNNIKVIFINCKRDERLYPKLIWNLIPKKIRKRLKKTYEYLLISKTIQKENRIKKIDIIQYASYLAMGKFPEKNIPSCIRISSYAKLWQKYYNYSDEEEINNEIQQFKNAKFLFCPSKYIANYIKEDLQLKNDIKIIESPFVPFNDEDESAYQNLKQQLKQNGEYLLFFGSIGLLKGAKEIGNIANSILTKYPNLNIVLVGKELSVIERMTPIEYIKYNAKEHCDKIIHVNKLTHNKLYPIIKHAKAILLPSRVDNLPNACIESMGLKKVVIGSKGASFEQLIKNGESGLLFEAGNVKELENTIDRLMLLSDNEIRKIEENAYKRSLALSPEKIAEQTLTYYEFVIKNWEQNECKS